MYFTYKILLKCKLNDGIKNMVTQLHVLFSCLVLEVVSFLSLKCLMFLSLKLLLKLGFFS